MIDGTTSLVCHGCHRRFGAADPLRFSCPAAAAGDDVDHVLRRVLPDRSPGWPTGGETNPFARYRTLLHSWHVACARGLPDAAFLSIVGALDEAVARVDGAGFRVTPLVEADALGARLGMQAGHLLVKVEAGNVSGSHKARHLAGIMIALMVDEAASGQAGRGPSAATGRTLAIASCGNAALAAAVVARAAGRALDVYVPTWAARSVLERLDTLGACIVTCPRDATLPGDPCYHRFRAAVRAGALPFCCQGPDNGLTIEGGCTLAWEMVDARHGREVDRIFVQVGGGALASACAQGFAEAARLGRIARVPRLHAVQTRAVHPLARAYEQALRHATGLAGLPPPVGPADWPDLATRLAAEPAVVAATVAHAVSHRHLYMWPWEHEPHSLASGILDDETHDWAAVLHGMLESGGYPVLVDEDTLQQAHALAHAATDVDVCHTGAAGLAGLLTLARADPSVLGETVCVIFSGHTR